MSGSALVRAAARNNAEWCDAFCRTYGIVGRFDTDSWWSPVRGFRPLFRAEWLLREPGRARAGSDRGWSALTTQAQLVEWESTWAESHEASGFFRPALLVDEAVGMLARYDGGRIVAGAVANRSTTVIGLSNVFDAGGDQESAWLGAAAAANALWGQMPIVGYDTGAALDAARRAGFESIGELVVWLSRRLVG